MKSYYGMMMKSALLRGVDEGDIGALLGCVGARKAAYGKGEMVFTAGGAAEHVGMVLSGGVQVVRDDYFGNRAILARLRAGELFGEVFACAGMDTLPVGVEAVQQSDILLLDYRRVISTCPSSCAFHNRLIENMLSIIARKNLMLNTKIEALSGRTIRDKLMSFLTAQAQIAGGNSFSIPFNRQELADYLAADRSALSREISKMQAEGILRCSKSEFELLSPV